MLRERVHRDPEIAKLFSGGIIVGFNHELGIFRKDLAGQSGNFQLITWISEQSQIVCIGPSNSVLATKNILPEPKSQRKLCSTENTHELTE